MLFSLSINNHTDREASAKLFFLEGPVVAQTV